MNDSKKERGFQIAARHLENFIKAIDKYGIELVGYVDNTGNDSIEELRDCFSNAWAENHEFQSVSEREITCRICRNSRGYHKR